ncbi:MAG: transposase [Capnocytophaga sp.]|nr:transposase [Capnocytophaga sp.]
MHNALRENIHFMYIAGNSEPDFRTINDFRGKILKYLLKLNSLPTQVFIKQRQIQLH